MLLHGAGSDSWYWHLAAPLLRERGHDVVTPDLPCDDDAAGIPDYAAAVIDAVGDRTGVILVAQSMAAFTVPFVCERVTVDLVVLVAAMAPLAGESPGEWWDDTGQAEAKRALAEREDRPDTDDPVAMFLHDVPADVAAESANHVRMQSATPFRARHASIAKATGPPPFAPIDAPPMAERSFISVATATRHPSPSSPRRIASGMRVSVKYTSLNSASPVI